MKEIISEVQELYRAKDWRSIIELYHDHPERNQLLWVFPSVENLHFIKSCVESLHCDRVLSVGCGSGLLEWIITEATGIPVSGLEVDASWWSSKYAPPTFIPLLFTPAALDRDTISLLETAHSTALLFCYFNNMAAFQEYLKYFSGKVLIIIGPDNKGVYSDPQPFGKIGVDWELFRFEEVRNSRDFIAVYCKKSVEGVEGAEAK